MSEEQPELQRIYPVIHETNGTATAEQAVQPLDERGDAMLFEIDALGSMPFDQEVVMPYD